MQTLQPAALRDLLSANKATVVDVRTPEEWAIAHIAGSQHVPMSELPQRLDELRHLRGLVLVCHHGIRSERAGRFLEQNGFAEVAHLAGGLAAWAEQVDPSMPQY